MLGLPRCRLLQFGIVPRTGRPAGRLFPGCGRRSSSSVDAGAQRRHSFCSISVKMSWTNAPTLRCVPPETRSTSHRLANYHESSPSSLLSPSIQRQSVPDGIESIATYPITLDSTAPYHPTLLVGTR